MDLAWPPPAGIDWDLWLDPAPFRPYHSAYHPWRWRPWWDFGGGTVGDKGKLMVAFSGGRFLSSRGFHGGLLLPEEEFRDYQEPAKTLRRVPDHYWEWTLACKTGTRTVCPIDFGCEITETATGKKRCSRKRCGRRPILSVPPSWARRAEMIPSFAPGRRPCSRASSRRTVQQLIRCQDDQR